MKYEVIRSNRRTVAISVKEGKVILRTPLLLKDRECEKIIKKHESWILEKLEKYKNRSLVKSELSEEEIEASFKKLLAEGEKRNEE